MKIAIVSCGLLDSMLPLLRRLSRHAEIDLYISVYGEKFNENVASFDLSGLPTGMIEEETSRRIVGKDLISYIQGEGGQIKLRLFKYSSLKIFNKENILLHRSFASELNQSDYDLVHFNGYRGALMFLYAFLKRKTAKVWTIHDPILHSGEDKWQTRLAYSIFRFLDAHFILHNSAQRPEFIRRYNIKPNHCHFIRFGPLDIFKIFKNGNKVVPNHSVLFYGRISPYKGVEYLIEAAKIIRSKVPALKVVIAGKPNYPIDLDALKNDQTFVIKDYFIENQDMVRMIEESSFVVCPYTDATQSGVIMAAYAFHKPVLATSVGGLPEVVEEGITGRLVPPKDSQALAEAMVKMLTEENELRSMHHELKTRYLSGPYSWEGIAKKTMEVYTKALSE